MASPAEVLPKGDFWMPAVAPHAILDRAGKAPAVVRKARRLRELIISIETLSVYASGRRMSTRATAKAYHHKNMRLRFLAVMILSVAPLAAQRGGRGPAQENFRFKFMGPAVGNRISAAAGIP